MNRREFIRTASFSASAAMLGNAGWASETSFPVVRTPEAKRKFKSAVVERTIDRIQVVHRQQGTCLDVRELFSEHIGYDGRF